MTDCKVSVVTVCYNSEQTIRCCMDSVLQQTYENIEYIVIDGGSTDGTVDVILEYEPFFQGRMKWVSEPDEGIYDAMNKGIAMCGGDLIGILNSDDYYEPGAAADMAEAMAECPEIPYQILYGAVRTIKDGKEESVSILSHHFLKERMIGHPACFVTRAVYEDFGGYDTQYISAADYDFMLRMNEKEEVKFRPVYRLIANFRTGGMCGSVEAWRDLLRVERDRGLLSERKYRTILMKDRLITVFNKIFRTRMNKTE